MFNDPTSQINELTQLVKQDITLIHTKLDDLEVRNRKVECYTYVKLELSTKPAFRIFVESCSKAFGRNRDTNEEHAHEHNKRI